MLLLLTLIFAALSLWFLKKTLLPDHEQFSKFREDFLKQLQDNPTLPAMHTLAFVACGLAYTGFQSIYIGFAVSFLLTTGVLFAKLAALAACVLFMLSVLKNLHLFTKMCKALDDPLAFRDLIMSWPSLLKRVFNVTIISTWLAFYATLTYFLLQ